MEKKNFKVLIILIVLLAVSILLMCLSLLVDERVFGQVSSYIAIACVVVTLVGVVIVVRSNRKAKLMELNNRVKDIENEIGEEK